ncbi:hypothetical protein BJF77_14200 [Kocuria sp. CNJ-770]|nr:hypothetical protein BJF77_14200 [Kocuria sp. CNJ-770]
MPSFCMFASARSLVSCRAPRPASSTYSSRWEASTEATTGLQMSQPRPVPNRPTTSSHEDRSRARTASKSSARESSKCSHRAVETSTPALASSRSRVFLSIGTQEPHWVPAREHFFSSPISCTPQPICSRTAPVVTLLQEHSTASSGRSPAGASAPEAER